VPISEHPYVINPDAGYIVSTNNVATSEHIKHGISYSLNFPHRVVRIKEILDSEIEQHKISVEDTQRMQMDHLDI
jgi:acyl-homoserine lactone acylase PvdQ